MKGFLGAMTDWMLAGELGIRQTQANHGWDLFQLADPRNLQRQGNRILKFIGLNSLYPGLWPLMLSAGELLSESVFEEPPPPKPHRRPASFFNRFSLALRF